MNKPGRPAYALKSDVDAVRLELEALRLQIERMGEPTSAQQTASNGELPKPGESYYAWTNRVNAGT